MAWGVTGWSPTGNEVCLGGGNPQRDSTGLWLYDLQKKEFLRVLDGQITATCWSPAGTELTFCLGTPYLDVWSLPLYSGVPTAEALGSGQALDEHLRAMLAFYNRRIEADPQDAYAYSGRAQYHDCLGDKKSACADMRQWSAVQWPALPGDPMPATPRDLRRIIHLPFDCEFVFSAERLVNTTPIVSVAFGQKGRCEMKLFEIPVFVASLLGFGLFGGLDTPVARADFAFGEPMDLRSAIPVIDPETYFDHISCFSSDGLEMYITSGDRPGGYGGGDLWVLRRESVDDTWSPPENLGAAVNSPKDDLWPSISADGFMLYFNSDRVGGHGYYDIYVTTRPTRNSPWGPAVNLGATINSSATDGEPWISTNGLELYFQSYRAGGYGRADIYVARRATVDDPWDAPVNLGPVVNSAYSEQYLSLSPDGLLLLFSDHDPAPYRPGGYGNRDIWMTRRASLAEPWQTPVNLGPPVNGSAVDFIARISLDGSALYFSSNRSGVPKRYCAPIIPIVDFTGDGHVDGKDLLAMVVQLGGNDSLCDIGPYAWGDGVVDAKDLEVLAGYIGKEVEDPTLVAHWAFDETEGEVAVDSAGDYDGTRVGGATWQPEGGMISGALKCDGVTGCVVTDTIPDLGTGPFSVIAWVKGGAPGQIILSHGGTTDWLMANPIDGSLMTKLTSAKQPLAIGSSEAVITDGKWHRIALVWDGADRILYADGKEVARDPQPDITVSDGKFIIGAGSKTGTGWSGLIDDVRIYNRVVRP
jgi:Tol biopolymer transport system component